MGKYGGYITEEDGKCRCVLLMPVGTRIEAAAIADEPKTLRVV